MNRPDWVRTEEQALDLIARCSEVAPTIDELLDAAKDLPRAHRKIVRIALLIIDVKRAAQAHQEEASAQVTQRSRWRE
jgi:hypothetical protein